MDVKDGYGEMTWPDNTIYHGTWQQGIQEGIGWLQLPNGDIKAGFFKENVLTELLTTFE
jgi:hypothetical protein